MSHVCLIGLSFRFTITGSVAVLAVMPVRSPGELIIFILLQFIFLGVKLSQKQFSQF